MFARLACSERRTSGIRCYRPGWAARKPPGGAVMLRTLAAEAARRFGSRVSFAAVAEPAEPAQPAQPGSGGAPGSGGTPGAGGGPGAQPEPGRSYEQAMAWRISFADLDRLSDEAAAGLAFHGVLPGDVVAIALPTVPEFPICCLAAVKIG